MRKHWSEKLAAIDACKGAVAWARTQPSLVTAWKRCERGDWLLWLIGKTDTSEAWSEERKPLVRIACDCAQEALPIFERECPDDKRPRQAIETAERWCRGDATPKEVSSSWSASRDAARAAAGAAAWAAWASWAAAGTAAAAAARDAAWDAAWVATGAETLKAQADIVRRHCPKPPRLP